MYTKVINGFVYEIGGDEASLIGCDIEATNLTVCSQLHRIPVLVENKPVTKISQNALSLSGIRKLELPASISSIGHKAFFGSSIEEIYFYAPVEYPWQELLTVETSAFRDCQRLHVFETQQFVTAEYLSFSRCSRLKYFGVRNTVQFKCVHPKAFQDSGVESISIANNGWLQVDALAGCNISNIHLKDAAKIAGKTLDYIKKHHITLNVYAFSRLSDLAYEGFSVIEAGLPF